MHDGDAVLSELAACTVLDAARLHMETGCELTLYYVVLFFLFTFYLNVMRALDVARWPNPDWKV